jgi:hypothetical protein
MYQQNQNYGRVITLLLLIKLLKNNMKTIIRLPSIKIQEYEWKNGSWGIIQYNMVSCFKNEYSDCGIASGTRTPGSPV